MPEQQRPIVTDLALADALDRLVNLIEELRPDADLRVEITTYETNLMKRPPRMGRIGPVLTAASRTWCRIP